jgi:hypothetical protein
MQQAIDGNIMSNSRKRSLKKSQFDELLELVRQGHVSQCVPKLVEGKGCMQPEDLAELLNVACSSPTPSLSLVQLLCDYGATVTLETFEMALTKSDPGIFGILCNHLPLSENPYDLLEETINRCLKELLYGPTNDAETNVKILRIIMRFCEHRISSNIRWDFPNYAVLKYLSPTASEEGAKEWVSIYPKDGPVVTIWLDARNSVISPLVYSEMTDEWKDVATEAILRSGNAVCIKEIASVYQRSVRTFLFSNLTNPAFHTQDMHWKTVFDLAAKESSRCYRHIEPLDVKDIPVWIRELICTTMKYELWIWTLWNKIHGFYDYCIFEREVFDKEILKMSCLHNTEKRQYLIRKAVFRGSDAYSRVRDAFDDLHMLPVDLSSKYVLPLLVNGKFDEFDQVVRDANVFWQSMNVTLSKEALEHLISKHLYMVVKGAGLEWLFDQVKREKPDCLNSLLRQLIPDAKTGFCFLKNARCSQLAMAILDVIQDVSTEVPCSIVFALGGNDPERFLFFLEKIETELGMIIQMDLTQETLTRQIQSMIDRGGWSEKIDQLLDRFLNNWRSDPVTVLGRLMEREAFQEKYTNIYIAHYGVLRLSSMKLQQKWHNLALQLCSNVGEETPWFSLHRAIRERVLVNAGLNSIFVEEGLKQVSENLPVEFPNIEGITDDIWRGSSVLRNLLEISGQDSRIQVPDTVLKASRLLATYQQADSRHTWRDLLLYAKAADYLDHGILLSALEKDLSKHLRRKSLETIRWMCYAK